MATPGFAWPGDTLTGKAASPLAFTGVGRTFETRDLLRGVTIDIAAGEVVAFLAVVLLTVFGKLTDSRTWLFDCWVVCRWT